MKNVKKMLTKIKRSGIIIKSLAESKKNKKLKKLDKIRL